VTSNFSKAHVTRNSSGLAIWLINPQRAIKHQCVLKEYPNLKHSYGRLLKFRLKLRWLVMCVLC